MKTIAWRPTLLITLAVLLAGCARGGPTPTIQPLAATPAETLAPDASAGVATQAVPPTAAPAAPLVWDVTIVQAGAVLPTANDAVTLARAPFTIRVTLPTPLAVKLNAYTTDQNFLALQPGFTFTEDCLLALCTGMDAAEDRLNPDQVLFVDVELTHYLYYLAPDDHRWSRADVSDTAARFERDVANLNATPIEQTTDPALYLLLFANAANEPQIDLGELKKIVLSFAQ